LFFTYSSQSLILAWKFYFSLCKHVYVNQFPTWIFVLYTKSYFISWCYFMSWRFLLASRRENSGFKPMTFIFSPFLAIIPLPLFLTLWFRPPQIFFLSSLVFCVLGASCLHQLRYVSNPSVFNLLFIFWNPKIGILRIFSCVDDCWVFLSFVCKSSD
jgi:hypothetical protein